MRPNHTEAEVPAGWPRPERAIRLILAVGYLGLLAVGMVAGCVWALYTGQTVAAVLLAAGAIGFGHLAGLAASQLRLPRGLGRATAGVTDAGETGLTYRYALGPYYWLLAVTGLTALTLAGVAVLALFGGGVVGWVVALLAGAGAAYLIWYVAVIARRMPGCLILTPTGIYHRSLTFEYFVPWFAVTDVVADQDEHPVIAVKAYPADGSRYSGRIRSYESQYLPILVVRAYRLGPNTLPAYRALTYYLRTPDQRGELSSPPRTFTDEP